MTQVTIAVPTFTGLQEQFTVDVEAKSPDGRPIDGEITAIVAGRPDDWDDEILGFVIGGGGSDAVPDHIYPELVENVQVAMMDHSKNMPHSSDN